jgi:ubiquitin-like protein Pup
VDSPAAARDAARRPRSVPRGGVPRISRSQDRLDEDVDAILDEIDDVLEENAEDFVRGFVQKGGQ